MTTSRFGQSVLIVDCKLDEMSRLRDIVTGLAFTNIDVASSANMGVSYLREQQYDLVLIAYDLGKNEKNGLQVIQEAFAEKLHLFQTLFLLIIDPDASTLLVGSLESAPDAYIVRPYDRAKIQSQLEKLIRVKKAVACVEDCMDKGDWQRGLLYCEKLISVYPGLKVYLERLQGICLLESKDYEKAEALFSRLSETKKQTWSLVGKGMACYYLGRYSASIEVLQKVVDQQHISVEAFSWLARGMYVIGELQQAVLLMRKSVMLQPTVPQLQSELGNLAAFSGEWTLAVDAFRAAVRYSRYSVFQEPDHYFALVRSMIALHAIKPMNVAELEMECVRLMEDVSRDTMDDQSVRCRSHIILAELRDALGNSMMAEGELDLALTQFRGLSVDQQWRWIDWMQDASEGKRQAEEVRKIKNSLIQSTDASEWVMLMIQGLQLYRKKMLSKSFSLFRRAIESGAACPSLVLNTAQVAVEMKATKDSGLSEAQWHLCLRDLNGLNFGGLAVKQQTRYQKIMKRFIELQV